MRRPIPQSGKEFHILFSFFRKRGNTHRTDARSQPAKPVWRQGASKRAAHLAIAVGSREAVNALTERLRADGHTILSEPRLTGDGYYESAIADPEENIVEITA